ncbi:MAG: hypothetical protein IIW68_04245 [Lachnospiraceae bacterium]|nr:hypothetical protein [Lachnospiraceae bacterium]
MNAKELRAKLIEAVSDKIRKGQKVVLPVPQYGRGLELLVLMRRTFPNLRVCVDSDFVTYAKKMLSERMWYFADAYECMNNEELYEMEIFGTQMPVYDYDILLLADTHLKKTEKCGFCKSTVTEQCGGIYKWTSKGKWTGRKTFGRRKS